MTSPGSQSNVTVELRGTSRCFRTLNITNIRVIGDVTMNCSGVSTAVTFVLNHATVDVTQSLIVDDSNFLVLNIRDSVINDCLLSFAAQEEMTVDIVDSTFMTPLPVVANGTIINSELTRDKSATGLHLLQSLLGRRLLLLARPRTRLAQRSQLAVQLLTDIKQTQITLARRTTTSASGHTARQRNYGA